MVITNRILNHGGHGEHGGNREKEYRLQEPGDREFITQHGVIIVEGFNDVINLDVRLVWSPTMHNIEFNGGATGVDNSVKDEVLLTH